MWDLCQRFIITSMQNKVKIAFEKKGLTSSKNQHFFDNLNSKCENKHSHGNENCGVNRPLIF